MEEQLKYSFLYDYYGDLLTDKQRCYFEDYYFNNLSLAEISENHQVSRNAVHKSLKEIEKKLEELENKLHLVEKRRQIEQILEDVDSKIANKILEIL